MKRRGEGDEEDEEDEGVRMKEGLGVPKIHKREQDQAEGPDQSSAGGVQEEHRWSVVNRRSRWRTKEELFICLVIVFLTKRKTLTSSFFSDPFRVFAVADVVVGGCRLFASSSLHPFVGPSCLVLELMGLWTRFTAMRGESEKEKVGSQASSLTRRGL